MKVYTLTIVVRDQWQDVATDVRVFATETSALKAMNEAIDNKLTYSTWRDCEVMGFGYFYEIHKTDTENIRFYVNEKELEQ